MCEAVGHPVLPARAHPHRPAARPASCAGRVARAAPGRGARARTRRRRRSPPLASGARARPPANLARRETPGAARRDHVRRGLQGRDRGQDVAAGEGAVRPQRPRARRHREHHLHRPPPTSPPSSRPARPVPRSGSTTSPLLGAQEQDVPHGMPRCIRVLVHCYTERPRDELQPRVPRRRGRAPRRPRRSRRVARGTPRIASRSSAPASSAARSASRSRRLGCEVRGFDHDAARAEPRTEPARSTRSPPTVARRRRRRRPHRGRGAGRAASPRW